MHTTHAQRKQEILMRSSVARLKMINAVDAAGKGVERCVSLVPFSSKVVRYALVAGAGALSVGVLKLVWRSRKPQALPAPQVKPAQNVGRYLLVQVLTMVLLPWLRQKAVQSGWEKQLRFWHPARIFFRWIGLEK